MSFNVDRELIVKALSQTDPFVEHEGKLYKMFDGIVIKPLTCYREKKVGLFKTETEEYIGGIEVKILYHGKVIKQIAYENISIDHGDEFHMRDIGGIFECSVHD